MKYLVLRGVVGWALFCASCIPPGKDIAAGSDDSPIPVFDEPALVEDGQTSFTGASSDGKFTVQTASDALPAALRAQPTIADAEPDPQLLWGDEQLVSNSYLLDLKSTDNFVGEPDAVTIDLTFDIDKIPADKRTSLYLYAKVFHPDSGLALPVPGQIVGNRLHLSLPGAAKAAAFSVVFDPSLKEASSSGVLAGGPSCAFAAIYDRHDNNIGAWVAYYLNVKKASDVSDAQFDTVMKQFADNASAACTIYEKAGFRNPRLQVLNGSYPIYFTRKGGSYYLPSASDESARRSGSSYGLLYIEPSRLVDARDNPLGSLLASIAHELFHSIQDSYARMSPGLAEGTAATYGITIDSGASAPLVRLGDINEKMKLSSYLLVGNRTISANADGTPMETDSSAYSNQDFFAYVGRVAGDGSLGYLAEVFNRVAAAKSTLVAGGQKSARVRLPRSELLHAMDDAFKAKFSSSFPKVMDLPSLYADFVRNRAMDHSAPSQLRSGDPSSPGFDPSLFHRKAIVTKLVDPNTLSKTPLTGSIGSIAPFSTRVLIVTPIDVIANTSATLTLQVQDGLTVNKDIKYFLYRHGAFYNIGASTTIAQFAHENGDGLMLLIVNLDFTREADLLYELGTAMPM